MVSLEELEMSLLEIPKEGKLLLLGPECPASEANVISLLPPVPVHLSSGILTGTMAAPSRNKQM
jgi:hypothetical protein